MITKIERSPTGNDQVFYIARFKTFAENLMFTSNPSLVGYSKSLHVEANEILVHAAGVEKINKTELQKAIFTLGAHYVQQYARERKIHQ